MSGEFWFETVLIVLLILVNGFFSGAEIAIVSVRRSRIDQLIEQGHTSAQVVGRLKDDSDRFLATVQIGVTLVSSLASAMGVPRRSNTSARSFARVPSPSCRNGVRSWPLASSS